MANGNVGNPGASNNSSRDRAIILIQLGLGAGLVVFGALLLVIFKATNVLGTSSSDLTTIGGNVATAVLGIGAALLPAGAASAASSRILASLPSQSPEQEPVVMGITASPVAAGGANVTGHILTSDDGFWFVQYGDTSGDYKNTVFEGRLTARPEEQDISTKDPVADLAAGEFFRVGFTTNKSGLTVYSKEGQVLQFCSQLGRRESRTPRWSSASRTPTILLVRHVSRGAQYFLRASRAAAATPAPVAVMVTATGCVPE